MKAVIDTQLLLRAVLKRRPSAALGVVEAAFAQRIVGVTSPALLDELHRVLSLIEIRHLTEPPLDDDLIQRTVDEVAASFHVTAGAFRDVDKVPTDLKDNPLVEAALEGSAEVIISDDHDLLNLKFIVVAGFKTIEILPPSIALRRAPQK